MSTTTAVAQHHVMPLSINNMAVDISDDSCTKPTLTGLSTLPSSATDSYQKKKKKKHGLYCTQQHELHSTTPIKKIHHRLSHQGSSTQLQQTSDDTDLRYFRLFSARCCWYPAGHCPAERVCIYIDMVHIPVAPKKFELYIDIHRRCLPRAGRAARIRTRHDDG